MLTKRELKELTKRHNIYLKKRLGQNFLIDKNIRDKIIRLLELRVEDIVLEIGAGLGAITDGLVEKVKFVYAIEKDKKLYLLSKELFSAYKNLELIHCDFLKFDIRRISFGKLKVVGTLPYYITTPIIQRLINFRERIEEAYITVQKEVGQRLCAGCGEDGYCSFSLFVQFYSDIEILMDIKRNSFFPVPKVDSSLVKLRMLHTPRYKIKSEDVFFKVIRKAFSQRRKTLLSALSFQDNGLGLSKDALRRLLFHLGIDPNIRAEALSLKQFACIADGVVDFLS